MQTTEERVTRIEVKIDDLKELMVDRFNQVDARFDRMDRRFLWLLGMQFTMLLAIMAGMFGIITRLL